MSKDTLTWSVLIYLFRHQGEDGKQLHHYFYDGLGHRPRRRDCGINIEAVDEMFDRFEQFDKRVITGADVLDRLMCLHVTRMYMPEISKDHTKIRMAKAENIAFADGKGCRINHQRYVLSTPSDVLSR
jgi:hypothetical protein